MHKYDSSISHKNLIKIATLGYTLSLHAHYTDAFHREAAHIHKDSLGLLDSYLHTQTNKSKQF